MYPGEETHEDGVNSGHPVVSTFHREHTAIHFNKQFRYPVTLASRLGTDFFPRVKEMTRMLTSGASFLCTTEVQISENF